MIRKDLDRNIAAQSRVLGAADLTPASTSELISNQVVRDAFADHGDFLHWQFAHCNLKHLKLPAIMIGWRGPGQLNPLHLP
jgi:hypothetical protein